MRPPGQPRPCRSAGGMHLPTAEVFGGSWLPATMSIALVCTHSPCSAKYLTYSPMCWNKEKSQALSPTSALESRTQPTGWRLAMDLLALHHHPHAKEPGWGFPGSQKMPAAAIDPRQQHHFPDRPTRLGSAPARPCLGKHGQLVSPTAGHIPDEALSLCLCMAMS